VPRLAVKWIGALQIKVPGAYFFQLTSYGTSKLMLDGKTILTLPDNVNSNSTRMTPVLDMASGYHSLIVQYKEIEGKSGCLFEYAGPDSSGTLQAVPAAVLWHQRGPCSLQLPHVAKPPCSGPRRWALDDGEHCEVRCLEGYFSSVSGGSMELLHCKAGKLLPPGFVCDQRPCFAPQVALAKNPSCREGAAIRRGGSCTPQCRIGYGASIRGAQSLDALQCDSKGTLHGYFTCEQKNKCKMPVLPIIHGASPPCEGGGMISHGDGCLARCQPGYAPSRKPTCNNGMLQPPTFVCNPQPSTSIITTTVTVAASTQTVFTQTTTTKAEIAAFPTMLQDLSVMVGQFINATGDFNFLSDLPHSWPMLSAMVVLLLCLCLCLVCLIRGSSSKRNLHHKWRRADSWASSGDDSDTELVPNDISNQDMAAAAAAAAEPPPPEPPRQHPHPAQRAMAIPSPQAVMEGLNTEQRGRLDALRPRGLRQHTTDSYTSFMLDNVTPQQHLSDSPSLADALLGSQAASRGVAHDVPQGQAPSFRHGPGVHSATPSPRILDFSWTPLAAVPTQVQERDPYTWCDVQTEENAAANIAWSDVRVDE